MFGRSSDAISPTAHYTGEVWRRNGLSDEALSTWQGRLLHATSRPVMAASRALGGDTLEDFLLARHALIDRLLEGAIASGEIGQVVEIASGLSPRGIRLTSAHPEITYVEADLPAMAQRKRRALEGGGRAGERVRVRDLDAFADPGSELSLAALTAELDRGAGLAIVTEGLLNYFPRGHVERLWRSIADALSGFPSGLYTSDLHLAEHNRGLVQRVFSTGLGVFVRGRIHMHFAGEADALDALASAGLPLASLHHGTEAGAGRGASRVHVIEARPDRQS